MIERGARPGGEARPVTGVEPDNHVSIQVQDHLLPISGS